MIKTLPTQPIFKPYFTAYLPCSLEMANELNTMLSSLIVEPNDHAVFSALVAEVIYATVLGDPDNAYLSPKLLEVDEMCCYSYAYHLSQYGFGVTYNELAMFFVGALIPIVEANKMFFTQCSFIWHKLFRTSNLDIIFFPTAAVIAVNIDVDVTNCLTETVYPTIPTTYIPTSFG